MRSTLGATLAASSLFDVGEQRYEPLYGRRVAKKFTVCQNIFF